MNNINWKYLKNGDEMYLATVPTEGELVVVADGKGKFEKSWFMDFKWWKDCEENEGNYNVVELEWRPERWYRAPLNMDDPIDYTLLARSIGRKEKIEKILID